MVTLAERRKLETRQGILGAAYRVFAEKGYAQATVDDIAAACGVSNCQRVLAIPSKRYERAPVEFLTEEETACPCGRS